MKKRTSYTNEPIKARVIPDFLPGANKLRPRQSAIKVIYDVETDALRMLLSDKPIAESKGNKNGLVLDYDSDGNLVGVEILDASKRSANPRALEFAVAG